MIRVNVEQEVGAPIASVWELLEDFGNMDWFPGWTKIEVVGSGIGMIRRIYMAGLDPIEEVLEAMNPESHYLCYRIPNIPMPVSNYRAEAQLHALPNERTLVNWRCEATAEGIGDDDASAMLEDVYERMITSLEAAARRL